MSGRLPIGPSEYHGKNLCFAECVHPEVKEMK